MKKYITFILVGFLMLGFHSCDDNDLEVEISSPVQEQYFKESTLSYSEAVIGIYQKLMFLYLYNGNIINHDLFLFQDDDLTTDKFAPFESFSPINSGNGSINRFYSVGYQLINRANVVIENIETNGPVVFAKDLELKDWIEGEARFLRAYMYFRLADYLGTPPLVEKQITDLDFKPTNSAPGAVLDFAISELELAASLLPDNWDDANIGRATKSSALGILAKALLTRGGGSDFGGVIDAANKIAALGHTMTTVFSDNFGGGALENNIESLFEVQFGQNEFNNVWLNNDQFDVVGSIGGYWGFFNGHWSRFGAYIMEPTASLQAAFEDGDPRKDMTFRDGQIKKYIDNATMGGEGVSFLNNARLIRYADVLLMKAEAVLLSGGSKTEAIVLLNQVRARARGSIDPASDIPADLDVAETGDDVIFQWIMNERRIELAAEEGWRWNDLKRWHRAGKVNLSQLDFSSKAGQFGFDVNTHLLMPFPSGEVEVSNGSLVQNSGY